MGENKTPRVVLDTNIIISALLFGGNPYHVFQRALNKEITAITSPALINELTHTLHHKFHFDPTITQLLERKIKRNFRLALPGTTITKLSDEADNRILETAVAGHASLIITGDKELLALKSFQNIKILTAKEFLNKD